MRGGLLRHRPLAGRNGVLMLGAIGEPELELLVHAPPGLAERALILPQVLDKVLVVLRISVGSWTRFGGSGLLPFSFASEEPGRFKERDARSEETNHPK